MTDQRLDGGAAFERALDRIADIPARSLADLAVKSRVVRRWAAPEWWSDPGQPSF